MFAAASANATIVPEDKYGAEIKTDANGQKYASINCYWVDLQCYDYPEIVEFPRTIYNKFDKKNLSR